jgi:hypothetical protein
MTNGVKKMAGATRWRKMVASGKEKPMNVATPSDKAMTMLVYENYIGHLVDKFNGTNPACKTKYTKEVGAMAIGVMRVLSGSMSCLFK